MSAIGLVKRGVNLNTIANTNQVFSDMVSLSVTAYGGDVTIESGTLKLHRVQLLYQRM